MLSTNNLLHKDKKKLLSHRDISVLFVTTTNIARCYTASKIYLFFHKVKAQELSKHFTCFMIIAFKTIQTSF